MANGNIVSLAGLDNCPKVVPRLCNLSFLIFFYFRPRGPYNLAALMPEVIRVSPSIQNVATQHQNQANHGSHFRTSKDPLFSICSRSNW